MNTVRLYERGGPYVDAEKFVVAGEIVSCGDPPDVLLWDERIFRYSHTQDCLVYVAATVGELEHRVVRGDVPDSPPPACPVCGRTFMHVIGCPEMDKPR